MSRRSALCYVKYLPYQKKVFKNCRLCRGSHGCTAGKKPLKKLKKSYLLFNKKMSLNQTDMNQNDIKLSRRPLV